MGEIGKRLHRKLTTLTRPGKKALSLNGWPPQSLAPNRTELIADGLIPLHADYVVVQYLSSYFAEFVSQLPEMRTYTNEVGFAENEYRPSGPPMSPLTSSFFTCWAFFDHQIGKTDETLADCFIAANDLIGLDPTQFDTLKKMSQSRMGIYEHQGMERDHVRLRELITDREFICHSVTGYHGKMGELWYVRLLPPLLPEIANHHLIFTTPYVLLGQSKEDWTAYLNRSMRRQSPSSETCDPLHALLKFGTTKNHWNEFVFLAYHHYQFDAIFLTGIPDLKATLPHA